MQTAFRWARDAMGRGGFELAVEEGVYGYMSALASKGYYVIEIEPTSDMLNAVNDDIVKSAVNNADLAGKVWDAMIGEVAVTGLEYRDKSYKPIAEVPEVEDISKEDVTFNAALEIIRYGIKNNGDPEQVTRDALRAYQSAARDWERDHLNRP